MNEHILFYGFRYALGRMTYAVHDVSEELVIHANKLSPKTRNTIIREIEEANRDNRLGMECDKEHWLKVLRVLQAQKEPQDTIQ